MKIIKRIFTALLIIMMAVFLQYFLPQRDIVKVVGTDVKRMDLSDKAWFWARADSGTNENPIRDVRFINATGRNGKPRVYRNEDTNWSFPPYFKFDSGDLNAEAQSLSQDSEQWVALSHYGWRIKMLTVFPNAVKVKPVAGPNVRLIPWFNIVFLSLLGLLILWLRRKASNFKKKRIDPAVEKIGDTIDDVADTAKDAAGSAKTKANSRG